MNEIIINKYYSDNPEWYHTRYHIEDLYMQWKIYKKYFLKEFPELEEEKLFLTFDYHDAIYIPGSKDNEENSALIYIQEEEKIYREVIDCILSTKVNNLTFKNSLEKVMHDLDWSGFKDYQVMFNNEKKILKEAIEKGGYTEQQAYEGQQAFYKSCLNKPIYLTKTFSKFNQVAQNNIKRRIIE